MRAVLLALLLIVAAPSAHARTTAPIVPEAVLDYSSDITVAKNGDMAVKDTIVVHSERRSIRHGIFRQFPLHYRDKAGNNVHVRFHVRAAERDGHPEPYRVRSLYGTSFVTIGDSDLELPAGDHTYTITYDTDRAIGFFKDLDELYWNVTGNFWDFPIRHAEAIVHLPEGARVIGHSEYTGKLGARGGHASLERRSDGFRAFTTAPLGKEEGFTFAAEFNKGVISPPTALSRIQYLMRDNAMTAAAVLGLLALAAYFFVVWFNVGRDPARGTIMPLFSPPRNLSAASMRFIRRMQYDGKCFAATLVSLAVKGYLTITDHEGTYVLTRTGGETQELPHTERAVAHLLFNGDDTVVLDGSNRETVSGAIQTLQSALKRDDEGTYFNTNTNWYRGGIGMLLASLAACAWYAEEGYSAFFMIGWVTAWIGILVGVLALLGGNWKSILFLIGPRLFIVVGLLIYGWVQIGIATDTLKDLAGDIPWLVLSALLGQAILVVAFHRLLRAPTAEGGRIRDEIDGFRMYLHTAEKDRLERMHPPQLTPAVFEQMLPYAIALDAENQWSKRFEAEANRAGLDREPYMPNWYTGAAFGRLGYSGFVSNLGSSIATASASAAAMPMGGGGAIGSYGGGGGGFSGGGGGGGGGGGW
jgi:predicted membrane protein DUF2207